MAKFTPFDKLSKKKKEELVKRKRITWGSLNPATRKPDNPKAYKRKKTDDHDLEDNFVNEDNFFSKDNFDSGIGLSL